MKAARLIVLGIALAAGGGAALLMSGQKAPEPKRIVQPPPAPPPPEAVLVATHDVGAGSVIAAADVRWETWAAAVPAGVIRRSFRPNATSEIVGLIARTPILSGAPLYTDRLRDTSSLMSAVLPTGTRAVAIDLADQGRTSAGGFIKPDERVDVIKTYHPDDAPSALASETILTNVRVLAIGPTLQEKPGERTIFGSTATLELTGEQAEKVVLAQRSGLLTLALRSMTDVSTHDPAAEEPKTMLIIRSGNASQTRVR